MYWKNLPAYITYM